MLTADAGKLPSGEWIVQVLEDGTAIEAVPLGSRDFLPLSARKALEEQGYRVKLWREVRDNFLGWHITQLGYSVELSRQEAT